MVELSRFELSRRGVDRAMVLAGYEELDYALSMFRADGTLRRSSAAEVLEYMADPRSPDDFSIVYPPPGSRPIRDRHGRAISSSARPPTG